MSISARVASHCSVFAVGMAEVAACRTQVRRFDSANHDKVHRHFLCLDKIAIERCGRASAHRSAGYELGEMVTGTAGENICLAVFPRRIAYPKKNACLGGNIGFGW